MRRHPGRAGRVRRRAESGSFQVEKGGSPNESVSGFQARSRTIRFLRRDSRRRGMRHLANALSAGASARLPTISRSTNHDRALIVVVAIPFVTDLPPDLATAKH